MAAERESVDDFIAIARVDWLEIREDDRLHSADLSALTSEQRDGIEVDWLLPGPVHLACGMVASLALIPGVGARLDAGRCAGCCKATGLPGGRGSPKNSLDCRMILGLPVTPESNPAQ